MSFCPSFPPSKPFYITLPSLISFIFMNSFFILNFIFLVAASKLRKQYVKLTLKYFVSNNSFLDMVFIIKPVIHEDNVNCIDFFPLCLFCLQNLLYIFTYNAAQLKLYTFQMLSGPIGQVAIHWTVQF